MKKKYSFILIIGFIFFYSIVAQNTFEKEIVYLEFKPNCPEKYRTNIVRNFTTFYIDGVRFVYDNNIKPDTINCKFSENIQFREPIYLDKRRREMIQKDITYMIRNPFKGIFVVIKKRDYYLRYAVEWEPDWEQE